MNISRKILTAGILLLLLIISSTTFARPDDYQIRFKIKGIHDTTVMIGNYYGNGTFVKDTLKVDDQGRCTYNQTSLPKGIYLFIISDKNYFEFIADKDLKFSMETDADNVIGKMKITGSPENSLFYEYLDYNRKKYSEIKKLQDIQEKVKGNKDSVNLINVKTDSINNEIIKYKLSLIDKYPDSFVAFFIKAMKEPEIPEIPVLANGRKDSTFAYRYYRAHFWDGTDFTDDRLLRTPVFHPKLVKYFDKLIPQIPDSISHEADRLIELARPNPEMFKYMVWFCTWHYENSEIMGMDKVFVHMIDTYYVTNQTPWVNATVKENIIKKANRIKPLLLGSPAPNMIMVDTSNNLVSMHDIKAAFTILLFWDPDCGHCETEIPKIRKMMDEDGQKYNIKVFAVCSDSSLVKWKGAIRKKQMNFINVDGPRSLTGNYHDQYDIQTTPVIYILDEKKTIIAKQIKPEQIIQFISDYLKRNNH